MAGVDVTQWYGLFAPARTPPERVQALNSALNQVLADPAVVQLFERHGARVEAGTHKCWVAACRPILPVGKRLCLREASLCETSAQPFSNRSDS